jgi:hypothetical protein
MDPDLALVIGVVIGVFALPSIVSAFSERRAPRISFLTLMGGAGLAYWAVSQNPDKYSILGFPDLLIEVAARFIG